MAQPKKPLVKPFISRRADVLILLISVLLVTALPSLDLSIAALFYRDGEGFYLDRHVVVQFFYRTAPLATAVLVLALLITSIAANWLPARAKRQQKAAALSLLCIIIGPGLLVNTVLKDNWGRARPRDIAQFTDQTDPFKPAAAFTAALKPANECQSNCSFVSGHAASGFALMIFAFVGHQRRRWIWVGILSGAVLGFMRMAQGAHFFSDVLFSGLVVWFSFTIIASLSASIMPVLQSAQNARFNLKLPSKRVKTTEPVIINRENEPA